MRNKAHTLPYFLSLLEGLDYPKERIIVHIRSDMNEVGTLQTMKTVFEVRQRFQGYCVSFERLMKTFTILGFQSSNPTILG